MPSRVRLKTQPKRITSTLRNSARSLGYLVSDTIKDYNPVISELYDQTKETTSDLYQSIKEFSADLNPDKKKFGKELTETTKAIFNNFKSDLKTGNWYNTARHEKVFDIAGAMGFDESDFDFDFDDDWGDFEDNGDEDLGFEDDTKAILSENQKSTQQIISSVDRTGYAIASSVNQGQLQSAGMIVEANSQNTQALYSLNQKGFTSVTEAIMGLNKTIATIGQLGQPLTVHMQNASVFYTTTTQQLNDVNAKLDQLVKNTTVATSSGNGSNKAKSFSDLLGGDNIFDPKSYLDMIKENFKDDKELLDMITGGMKHLNLKNVSPGVLIGRFAMGSFTKMLKDSMSEFNDALKYTINDMFIKGAYKLENGYGILSFLLGDKLVPRNTFGKLKSFDASRYEKGPVQWDGVARKALTEVIPTTLLKILSAITGDEEYRYDYNKGSFVKSASIKQTITDKKLRYASEAGGELRNLLMDDINNSVNRQSPEYKRLRAEAEKFFINKILESDDPFTLSKLLSPNAASYFNDVDPAILSKLIRIVKDKSNKLRGFNTDRFKARNSYNEEMDRLSSSGDSILAHTANNSDFGSRTNAFGSTKVNPILVDVAGNSLFDYLKDISKTLRTLTYHVLDINGRDPRTYLKRSKLRAGHGGSVDATPVHHTGTGQPAPNGGQGGSNQLSRDQELINAINQRDLEEQELQNVQGQSRSFKERLGVVKGKINDYFKEHGFNPASISQAPLFAASNLLNRLSDAMTSVIIGNPEDPESGLFGTIATKTNELFENLSNKLKDLFENRLKDGIDKLFGEKDEDGKRHGGILSNFYNETKQSLRGGWDYIKGTAREYAWGKAAARRAEIDDRISTQRDIFNRAQGKVSQLRHAKEEPVDNGTAYAGRRITRTGLAVVSEGEMIIPSELNPYYRGVTNKKDQRRRESLIAKRYGISRQYDQGSAAVNLSDDEASQGVNNVISFDEKLAAYAGIADRSGKKIKRLKKQKFQDTMDMAKEGDAGPLGSLLYSIFDFSGKVRAGSKAMFGDSDRKSLLESFNNIREDLGKGKGAIGAGALIGMGAGTLVGGPLFGALLGSTIGFVKSSETAQDFLFGAKDADGNRMDNGLLSAKFNEFLENNGEGLKRTGASAAIGGAAGLFFGSPVLGAVIGGSVGFVKSSESAQDFLFGKKDENGNRDDSGVLPKSLVDSFKKNKNLLPLLGAGAGVGALMGGPLGLVGGLAVGAGINYFNTSEEFREKLFGNKEDGKEGLFSKLKTDILDNIHETFRNTGNAIGGWLKVTGRRLADSLHKGLKEHVFGKFGQWLRNRIEKSGLSEGIKNRLLGLGGGIYNGIANFSANRANRRMTKNIQKGYSVFNKEIGRDMTSEEILQTIESRGLNLGDNADYLKNAYGMMAAAKTPEEKAKVREYLNDQYKNGDRKNRGLALGLLGQMSKDDEIAKKLEAEHPEIKMMDIQEETKDQVSKIREILERKFFGTDQDRLNLSANDALAQANGILGEDDADEKTETVMSLFGPIQTTRNNQGEVVENANDKETKEALEGRRTFLGAMKQIPLIGGAIGGLSGLFSKMFGSKDEKEDKEPSFFDKLKELLLGSNGLLSGLGQLLPGILGGLALGGAFTGAFDKVGEAVGNTTALKGNDTESVLAKSDSYTVNGVPIRVGDDGKPIVNADGSYLTMSGEPITGNLTYTGTDTRVSTQMKKNLVGGLARSAVFKTKDFGVGSKTINKIVEGGKTVFNAGKNVVSNAKNFFTKGAANNIDDLAMDALRQGSGVVDDVAKQPGFFNAVMATIKTALGKVATALTKIPFLPKGVATGFVKGMPELLKGMGQAVKNAGAKLSAFAGKALPVIGIVYIVGSGINAWGNAESILGITEDATIGQRVIATLIGTINAAIPFIGGLIPNKVFVNIFMKIAPILGIDVSELQAQRDRAKEEVDAYNEQNGTQLSIEEYNKMNGKAGIITKAGDAVKGFATSVKEKGFVKTVGGAVSGAVGKIDSTFNISDLLEFVKSGDVKGFFDYKPKGLDDDENAGSKMSKMIPVTLAKHVLMGPVLVSGAAHSIGKVFTNIKDKLSETWNYLKSESEYGDQLLRDRTKSFKDYLKVDNVPDSPISGIVKAVTIGARLTSIPRALLQKVGDTIAEGFGKLKDAASNSMNVLKTNDERINERVKAGDVAGIWNLEFEDNPENPVGGFIKGINTLDKVVKTPTTAVIWAGNRIAEGFNAVKDKVTNSIDVLKTNNAKIDEFAKAGDIAGIWGLEFENDPENPVGGFTKGINFVNKIVKTPVAGIHWIGNKIADAWNKVTDTVSENRETLSTSVDKLKELGKSGDLAGIWSSSLSLKPGDPLGGVWKVSFGISKLFNSAIAIFENIFGPIKDAVDGIVDSVGGTVDKVKNTFGEGVNNVKDFFSGVGNTVGNFFTGIGDSALNAVRDATGMGSGASSGFVSQFDSANANKKMVGGNFASQGCGPAVASMISGMPVDQAISASKKYQNPNGVDMRYFGDVLSKQGYITQNIRGSGAGAQALNHLKSGNKVVLLGRDLTNRSKEYSPFGPRPHYVLATGLDSKGNIIVNDPEAKGPRTYSPAILNSVTDGVASGAGDYKSQIWGFLKSKGLSDYAAAGLMGCWQEESSNSPDTLEGNWKLHVDSKAAMANNSTMDSYTQQLFNMYASRGTSINRDAYKGTDGHYYPGYGIAQWTGPRQKKLFDFAKANNADHRALATQLAFFWSEFQNRIPLQNGAKAANSVEAGTINALDNYEMSPGWHNSSRGKAQLAKRLAHANAIYKQFTGKQGDMPGDMGTFSGDSGTTSGETSSNPGIIGSVVSAFTSGFSKLFGGGDSSTGTTGSVGSANFTNGQPIDYMKSILGKISYSMSGPRNPDAGSADCSSTVNWAIKKAGGPDIGSSTATQYENPNLTPVVYNNGSVISSIPAEAQPNDVMFFRRMGSYTAGRKDRVGHVGLYLGNNQYIDHGGGMGPKIKQGPGKDLIKISRVNMPSAAGSGLLTYDDILRMSGGATGNVSGTTSVARNMLSGITSIARDKAAQGSISADVVTKLLKAIAKILEKIATNTGVAEKIYTLLQSYTGESLSAQKAAAGSAAMAAKKAKDADNDVDKSFEDLVRSLSEIAKG